jgi:hypothetical protein
MNIRIIAPPRGQAPEWVRGKWVGLLLPVENQQAEGAQAGGLGPPENQGGYPVKTLYAMAILRSNSIHAATWWEENATLADIPQLVFGRECCEIVE